MSNTPFVKRYDNIQDRNNTQVAHFSHGGCCGVIELNGFQTDEDDGESNFSFRAMDLYDLWARLTSSTVKDKLWEFIFSKLPNEDKRITSSHRGEYDLGDFFFDYHERWDKPIKENDAILIDYLEKFAPTGQKANKQFLEKLEKYKNPRKKDMSNHFLNYSKELFNSAAFYHATVIENRESTDDLKQLFKTNGWVQVGGVTHNPNSGNDLTFWIYIPDKYKED